MKSKRGQLAVTLTWFPAFLIIFFILLVFMFFSNLYLTKNKTVLSNNREVTFSDSANSLSIESQKNLQIFLEMPVEKDGQIFTIRELLILDASRNKDLIEKEFYSFVDSLSPNDCYGFSTENPPLSFNNKLFKMSGKTFADKAGFLTKNGVRMILEKKDKTQIILNFYSGVCYE